MKHKMCAKCGQIRQLEQFHRDKKNRDGRKHHCVYCNDISPALQPAHMGALRTGNWQAIIQRKITSLDRMPANPASVSENKS